MGIGGRGAGGTPNANARQALVRKAPPGAKARWRTYLQQAEAVFSDGARNRLGFFPTSAGG